MKKSLTSKQKSMKKGIIFYDIIPKLKAKEYLLSNGEYQKYLEHKQKQKTN